MRPRAVILRTDTVISPFGDAASEAFFTHQTIAETHDEVFGWLGFDVVRADTPEAAAEAIEAVNGKPVFLLLDRIYVSEKAAKDFLKAAKKVERPAALALEINVSVEYTLPLQDLERDGDTVVHDVLLVDGATLPDPIDDPVAWLRAIKADATKVVVPKRELAIDVPLPVIGERGSTTMKYPITSTNVVSIEHWVHVLWLNQIAFGIRWMEVLRRHPIWGALRAASALSPNPERMAAKLVRKGRGVTIHPTAQVSASILGDGVTIGPHATVRNSLVGEGTVVQDHAALINTVIGPRCLITENTVCVSCVSYPEATIGNYKLQVTLIGRGAYINAWAGFVDAKFSGTVKVAHKGALVSTERAFIGSVVGHRAKVAAKILIHPGREIPNDTVVVMRPDEVVSVVPEGLPANTPLVRDGGTLVPLGKESRAP